MPTVKRVAYVMLALPLILVACGGNGGGGQGTCEEQYWNGTFGICVPEAWTVIEKEQLRSRGIPEEVVVAFQAPQAIAGQFPTVTVTEETLREVANPEGYSAAGVQSVSVLPGYKQVDTRSVEIDRSNLMLHVFTAKPLPDQPERRFSQISTVHGGVGYTVTGVTPLTIDDSLEREIQKILRSLTFEVSDEVRE